MCKCGKALPRGPGRLRHVRECHGSVHKDLAAMLKDDGPDSTDGVVEVDAQGAAVGAARGAAAAGAAAGAGAAGRGGGGGGGGGKKRGRGAGAAGHGGGRGGGRAAAAPQLLQALLPSGALTDAAGSMNEVAALAALAQVNEALVRLRQRCASGGARARIRTFTHETQPLT